MDNRRFFIGFWVICGVLFVGYLVAAACGGFTDPKGATRVLQDQGYTNIEITGWRPFAGSDDDTFHTGFSATSPGGRRVTGVVTSGFFKGNTVRLD